MVVSGECGGWKLVEWAARAAKEKKFGGSDSAERRAWVLPAFFVDGAGALVGPGPGHCAEGGRGPVVALGSWRCHLCKITWSSIHVLEVFDV